MIRQIAIIGTGTMGRGIAYLAAVAGYETVIHDADAGALEAAKASIESTLQKGIERGKITGDAAAEASGRIHLSPDLEPAVETILASNTSSISITELAKSVERRDRFVGLHFFNPPHVMKLIEIVRGERTSDETVAQAREVAEKMGKTAIVVRDSPGFATSRLGVATGLEAIRMLEEGVASAEDIDKAMELGYNHPMGPLRLTDLVGLDVRLSIAEYLASTLGLRFDPPELLRRMVADGKLGRKTGQGFYHWPE